MSSQKILIVDDEIDILDLYAQTLRDEGYSVSTAPGGIQALAKIPQEKPDLLILDLLMPEVTGEDVCHAVKADPALQDIFIMVVSCKDDLESKLTLLNMGAEEYLVKPISLHELVARVNSSLKFMARWRGHSTAKFPALPAQEKPTAVKDVAPTIYLSASNAAPEPIPARVETAPQEQRKQSKTQKARYGVYRVESLAGSGGMGHVYKARDEVLDRYVAVKVLAKEWSAEPEFLKGFRREAKLIAAINHPRIAPIYTFAEEDGESYFVLQWCSGGSLSALIRKEGTIELLRATEMILQCARGLEAAWLQGVVHRDIKPSNLMFDENQYIKIVDFGVASRQDVAEKATESKVVMGSPSYMAPEQSTGQATDHRADIYSLGITFFQMLYGRLPYTANDPLELIAKHSTDPFPKYDDLGGTIPPQAYYIITKMTEKEPAARYQNYPEFIKDLEVLRNELYSQHRLKIPSVVETANATSLSSDNLFDLLANAYRQERSGVLKASWGRLQKKFLIQHKEVILFESPQSDENFWDTMARRDLIRRTSIPSQQEGLEESLNRLLFLRAFALEDFKSVYRETMMQSLLQVFRWPAFQGEFINTKIEHDAFVRISLAGLLLEAARMVPSEIVEQFVPQEEFIIKTEKFEEIVETLALPRAESFLLSRIEGESTNVKMLLWLTGFSQEQIVRTIYALERMGALEYRKVSPQRTTRRLEETWSEADPITSSPTPPIPTPEVKPPAEPAQSAPQVAQEPMRSEKTKIVEPPRRASSLTTAPTYRTVQEKYDAGKYWEVERLCGLAIRNNPSDSRFHHLMALALSKFPHSLKAAEESFRLAMQLNPTILQYRFDLALFLKDHGRAEDAVFECEGILEMSPGHQEAKSLLKEIERK